MTTPHVAMLVAYLLVAFASFVLDLILGLNEGIWRAFYGYGQESNARLLLSATLSGVLWPVVLVGCIGILVYEIGRQHVLTRRATPEPRDAR